MYQMIFLLLCVCIGYFAYKHAGAVRDDGSSICRKNCDACPRKCFVANKKNDDNTP